MTTTFEKRIRIARGVLFLAIGVWGVSWFFPEMIFRRMGGISMYGGKTEVYTVDLWREFFRIMAWTGGGSWNSKLRILGDLMLRTFNLGLLLSAPWLVGVYSRARVLLWLARLIAIMYVIHIGYHAVRRMIDVSDPMIGIGCWMGYGTAVLFVVGLFLIPRRPREAE